MSDYRHVKEAIGIMETIPPGEDLIVAPTGSGKSSIGRGVRDLPRWEGRSFIVVPSVEIGQGFSNGAFERSTQETNRVFTTQVLLNRIKRGELDPRMPLCLIQDEGHHFDETTRELRSYLTNLTHHVGLTATAFRGTPAETHKLHQYYKRIHRVLSIRDAIDRGVISMFDVRIEPLLNDDLIDVKNGEFSSGQMDKAWSSRVASLAALADPWWDGAMFTRPLMFTVHSVAMVELLSKNLSLPHHCVTAETGGRKKIFEDVVNRTHCLIQIKTVGEGVDLPMRVLIDASPTMSPVLWQQRVGRITRPIGWYCGTCGKMFREDGVCHGPLIREDPPVYVVTNHNLLRHGYLMEGCLPPGLFKEYRKKWPNWEPSGRSMSRIVGDVPGFQRFRPATVPLSDGSEALGFVIDDPSGRGHQYACLAHPATDKCILARRDWKLDSEGRRDYSQKTKWVPIENLPDLVGYSSSPASPLTPGQKNWWDKAAGRYGLDSTAVVNARGFQFLPILADLGVRIKV